MIDEKGYVGIWVTGGKQKIVIKKILARIKVSKQQEVKVI